MVGEPRIERDVPPAQTRPKSDTSHKAGHRVCKFRGGNCLMCQQLQRVPSENQNRGCLELGGETCGKTVQHDQNDSKASQTKHSSSCTFSLGIPEV